MSIKPDLWIRRMAREHAMIEPFEDAQVRRGTISYGVSSYGYDMRVSNEFKIFTNVNNVIVDPKAFDERSFVHYEGDVCIVPPNSFALARSVEYFRIPRNVLTLCVGKCVTGDTRVVDAATGAYVPITELGEDRETLGMKRWRLRPERVTAFLPQGRRPVFELTTRAGLKIRATANHPFRQLRGWTPLSELSPGDRIAVARHIPVFGRSPLPDWEAALLGLMISEGQCRTPGHSPTFTSTDPALVTLLERSVEQGGLGTVSWNGGIGHRLVNRRGRGGAPEHNRASRWLAGYGLNVAAQDKFVPQAIFTAPRESVQIFLRALFAGDGGIHRSGDGIHLEYYSKSRRLVEDVRHLLLRFGIFSLIRSKATAVGTEAHRVQITDREQVLRFARAIGFWPGSRKQLRLEREILPDLLARPYQLRSNFDTLPAEAWSSLRETAARKGRSLASFGITRTRPTQSLPFRIAAMVERSDDDDGRLPLLDGPVWDVVESIVPAGVEEVFDITVPEAENFVANDLIVHNSTYARCGIITNVTPFEPEWEGYVTLEISNTTPLPAKIYAGEGIAQVIFFESEEVCETSYADRKGKYQGQVGVTPPRL
jgi:deoxycytidine triphosphate deaminase/intein/homing endonuclease